MRTLTGTLSAAQKLASSKPFVFANFRDYWGTVSRLRFSRYYTGAEGDYYGAVCVAGDGSLIRARIDPTSKILYTQRVTSPGSGSTYSSWTSHGAVSTSGAVALCALGANVSLFYIDSGTLIIKVKLSTDNGASYGAATNVATAATAVTYLAAAYNTAGNRVCFWSVGAVVWRSRHNGTSWDTAASWSNSAASLTGLAAHYRLDWGVIITGTEPTTLDPKVWAAAYGDGVNQASNTWSTLKEISTAAAVSNVSFRSPALTHGSHWRLFFVEKYTGALAYSRLNQSTMDTGSDIEQTGWREPWAFPYTGDYGVAAAASGSYVWLSGPAGVWAASLTPASLDATADVLEASVWHDEDDARVRLVLRNEDGRYKPGIAAALRRGAELQLRPGYNAEDSDGPTYWVESIEYITGASPQVVVLARDIWWLLERWKSRRQFVWAAAARTVSQLLEFICNRAGLLSIANASSSDYSLLQPAFTIHPGESGKTAVKRLLAMVADVGRPSVSYFEVFEPDDVTALYAYGTTHAIIDGHYRDEGLAANRVRVFGKAVFDERFDFDEIESMGEALDQVLDINLTTTAQAGARAVAQLRKRELEERRDELLVFGVNCGQELYDVVSVTEAQMGYAAVTRRVLGLSWRYSTGKKPRYDMELVLGGV